MAFPDQADKDARQVTLDNAKSNRANTKESLEATSPQELADIAIAQLRERYRNTRDLSVYLPYRRETLFLQWWRVSCGGSLETELDVMRFVRKLTSEVYEAIKAQMATDAEHDVVVRNGDGHSIRVMLYSKS